MNGNGARDVPADGGGHGSGGRGRDLWFPLVTLAVFLLAAWIARDFPFRARLFPLTVAVGGAVLVLVELMRGGHAATVEQSGQDSRSPVRYIGWILGVYALTWAVGFVAAASVFVVAFLAAEAGARPRTTLVSGVLTGGALLGLSRVLGLEWIPPLWLG